MKMLLQYRLRHEIKMAEEWRLGEEDRRRVPGGETPPADGSCQERAASP